MSQKKICKQWKEIMKKTKALLSALLLFASAATGCAESNKLARNHITIENRLSVILGTSSLFYGTGRRTVQRWRLDRKSRTYRQVRTCWGNTAGRMVACPSQKHEYRRWGYGLGTYRLSLGIEKSGLEDSIHYNVFADGADAYNSLKNDDIDAAILYAPYHILAEDEGYVILFKQP